LRWSRASAEAAEPDNKKPLRLRAAFALRPDVGRQLAFQVRDLIFQQQFFLLEALQLQLVLSGFFSKSGYDIIEIAVFEVQLVNPLLKRIDISLHGQAPPFGR
jgi:hypothetical protein